MRGRLMAIPGVRQVVAVSRLPMMGSDLTSSLFAEGRIVPGAPAIEAQYRRATPDYFAAMGIPLRAGRWFDGLDGPDNPVALVDEEAARRVWPGQDPVGKRVKLGSPSAAEPWTTIIGVVGSIRHFGLDIAPQPSVYTPYAASPLVAPILVIRTGGEAQTMAPVLAETVRSAVPGVPAYNVFPMQELVDRSTARRRFLMLLLTAFAAGAMLLAAVGVYGSVSHSVAQRTREIGLRMALGASRGAALRMVLGEGLRLTLSGVALGWLAAIALTRLMQSVLFGVRPLDPVAFTAAAAILACCAILACAAPAWRAARLDPLVALREP
jgi:predicted permease